MKRIHALVLFLTVLSLLAWPEDHEKPIVSVIPFVAKGGISASEASTLTEQFEASLINTQIYTVILKSEMETILREQETYLLLEECIDEKCALELGKMLYADTIFLGTVSKIGSKYITIVKLVDIASGQSKESKTVEADSIENLSDRMAELAVLFAGGIVTGGEGMLVELPEEEKESQQTEAAGAEYAIVVFKSDPSEVFLKVYNSTGKLLIDQQTPVSKALSFDMYTIEAMDPDHLYYPFKDQLPVFSSGKKEFTLILKPNFGRVQITTDPPGAEVFRGGRKEGVTPFLHERVLSGSYTYVVKKDLYETASFDITVKDNQLSEEHASLTPAFVWLHLEETNSRPADVYVDNQFRGTLPFGKQLPFRDFQVRVEPKDNRYKKYEERITVRQREEEIKRQISLEGRYGQVLITTEPFVEGKVFLDGKEIGEAPDTFRALIGKYEVAVRGVHDEQIFSGRQMVTVKEGELMEVVLSLFRDKDQGIVENWKARAVTLFDYVEGENIVTQKEVVAIQELLEEVKTSDLSFPQLVAELEYLHKNALEMKRQADVKEEIASLTDRKAALQNRFLGGCEKRKRLRTPAWISIGTSILSGGFGVLSYFMAEEAFEKYNQTISTSEAVKYRNQAETWDTLMFVGGGFSLVGFGTGTILFLLRPNVEKIHDEILDIELEINRLKESLP